MCQKTLLYSLIFAAFHFLLYQHFTQGESCGFNASSYDGNISSPNYPQNYGPDLKCAWEISIPQNKSLKLTIHDFNLKDGYFSGRCGSHYLQVRDLDDGNVILKECGSLDPFSFVTSSSVEIEFSSDGGTTRRGFFLSWTVNEDVILDEEVPECGFKSNALEGILSFPKSLYNYREKVTCFWTIFSPPGTGIAISVHQFQLKPRRKLYNEYGNRYFWYLIDVFQITDLTSGEVILKQGGKMDPFVVASSNQIELRLTSAKLSRATALSLSWTVYTNSAHSVNADKCVYTLVSYVGSLSILNSLREDVRCSWTIDIPPGFGLIISVNDFGIRRCQGFLQIFSPKTSEVLLFRGGCFPPNSDLTSKSSVRVVLDTQDLRKFSLSWTIVPLENLNKESYSTVYSAYMSQFGDDFSKYLQKNEDLEDSLKDYRHLLLVGMMFLLLVLFI